MSSGVSSGLLETPAESPSASPFTTYLTMADPGLCLCVAPCFEHACACPFQKPGSDSQLLWRHEVHSNVAFSDSHCGSRPWQSHPCSSAQHREPRCCSKPIPEAPKTEQSLRRPLSGWALHSYASCCHTHTHTRPVLAASLPGPDVLSIPREPGLPPCCLRWHVGRQELYSLVNRCTKH